MSHRFGKVWSREEDILLKELYPKMRVKDLARKLGRSKWGISHRAGQIGLKKTITEEQKKKVIELAKTTDLTRHSIAIQIGRSHGSVDRILRLNGFRKGPRKSQFVLLKDFNSSQIRGGHYSKIRYALIHAYHRTCWDCKKTSIADSDFHIHHDYSRLPVQVLLLCKECHGKRHRRNFN